MSEFENMSRKELMALRTNIDKAIAAVGDRDRRNALKAAEEAVREHGYTLAELGPFLGGGPTRARRRATSEGAGNAARYRNPENPEQTWSGRGRRPRWVHDAEAAGRSLDDLRIE